MSWANGSTQKRITKDRNHRKATRIQKQHLRYLKTDKQLREIRQNSQRRQRGSMK